MVLHSTLQNLSRAATSGTEVKGSLTGGPDLIHAEAGIRHISQEPIFELGQCEAHHPKMMRVGF
jgi:hypothetical protein